ncbi:MAG: hypothetical protein LUD41_00950, partial [Phascolarctobacterium sp.]|nr:hypothetical protein [Phascolarctobacterium sp.]
SLLLLKPQTYMRLEPFLAATDSYISRLQALRVRVIMMAAVYCALDTAMVSYFYALKDAAIRSLKARSVKEV